MTNTQDDELRQDIIAIRYPDGLQRYGESRLMDMIRDSQDRHIDKLLSLITAKKAEWENAARIDEIEYIRDNDAQIWHSDFVNNRLEQLQQETEG